jgi:hypothetical protein
VRLARIAPFTRLHSVPSGQRCDPIYIRLREFNVRVILVCLYQTMGSAFSVGPEFKFWPGSGCCFSSDPFSLYCIYRRNRDSLRKPSRSGFQGGHASSRAGKAGATDWRRLTQGFKNTLGLVNDGSRGRDPSLAWRRQRPWVWNTLGLVNDGSRGRGPSLAWRRRRPWV